MTAPAGFVEASLADATETLATVIAIGEIAAIKEASTYGHKVKSLIILRCGQVVQLATPFSKIVERLSQTLEKDMVE